MPGKKLEADSERTMRWALAVSKENKEEGGVAEERLRNKCCWEQMSRTAIIIDYGDPRCWE